MLTCAKIAANATIGSCRQGNGAITGDIVLINWDDWKEATITQTGSVISAITMNGTDKAYKVSSKEKANESSVTMNKGTYGNSFVHQVILRAFDRSQTTKDLVNKLAQGRFVAIVEHVDPNAADTIFEVFGAQNGLTASAIEGNSTDADGVISAITLASEDNARESELPLSFFDTDYATTKAKIDALLAS